MGHEAFSFDNMNTANEKPPSADKERIVQGETVDSSEPDRMLKHAKDFLAQHNKASVEGAATGERIIRASELYSQLLQEAEQDTAHQQQTINALKLKIDEAQGLYDEHFK